jgi:hypothetical protein
MSVILVTGKNSRLVHLDISINNGMKARMITRSGFGRLGVGSARAQLPGLESLE